MEFGFYHSSLGFHLRELRDVEVLMDFWVLYGGDIWVVKRGFMGYGEWGCVRVEEGGVT